MSRAQPYSFGFSDSALAEAAGIPMDALHRDVDAICLAHDAIVPLARRLQVEPPRPCLGGFAYSHVSSLGAEVEFAAGSEPNVRPILRTPEDIDRLHEPDDYLACGVVPQRLRLLEELQKRRPGVGNYIGHLYEGPITTAVLLMGQDFLMLPYDDPARAHRLLSFCTDSALHYARALREHFGTQLEAGEVWIPDDFAGMLPPGLFDEFVLPYWERLYTGLLAAQRGLHSELLREEHLPLLEKMKIALFDPSADQYLTPEICRRSCPVPFMRIILSWDIWDKTADELQSLYRHTASHEPALISFCLSFLGMVQNMPFSGNKRQYTTDVRRGARFCEGFAKYFKPLA